MLLRDRFAAGVLLAQRLSSFRDTHGVVLGLPRGGIVVASEVAKALRLPLDVLVVKKIGAPGNSELAIGAVAPNGVSFIDESFATMVGADERYIRTHITELNDQIKKRMWLYQKGRKLHPLRGKTVIVVDDGAATGATVRAAIAWLKKKKAAKIVVALPLAPPEFVEKIGGEGDELVVLETPSDFSAVGQFYEHFPQVTDEEVIKLLT